MAEGTESKTAEEKGGEELTPFARAINIEFSKMIKTLQGEKNTSVLMRVAKGGHIQITNTFFNLLARAVLTVLKENGIKLIRLNNDGTVLGEASEQKPSLLKRLFASRTGNKGGKPGDKK